MRRRMRFPRSAQPCQFGRIWTRNRLSKNIYAKNSLCVCVVKCKMIQHATSLYEKFVLANFLYVCGLVLEIRVGTYDWMRWIWPTFWPKSSSSQHQNYTIEYVVVPTHNSQYGCLVGLLVTNYEFPTPTYVEFIYTVMGEIIAIKYLHLIIVL